MPLTVKEVKSAKPGRLSDGGGLYLLTKPSGSRSWVLRVQLNGERKDYGIGSFTLDPIPVDLPVERRKILTLSEAREKARIGRLLAKAGVNPIAHWKAGEVADAPPVTFEEMARECHREAKKGWRNGKHREEWLGSLERYVFEAMGGKSVEEIDAAAIQAVLLPIWLSKPETARRVKQRIGVVLDKAHAKGHRSSEAPMRAVNQLLRGIKQPKAGHFKAMPYKILPTFMSGLAEGDQSVGKLALRFLILTAARSGEVRMAQWKEIDLEAAEWRVPPDKAKAEKLHVVPLVPAALAILQQLKDHFEPKPDDLVFPGMKGPMSDATMAKVLRVNDGGDFNVHGMRSTFRDWAADNGFPDSWAEAAIAHANPNKTEAAYRRTSFFEHRRDKLMPAWAKFALGDNSNVVSLVGKVA
jgi:integrase